MQAVIALTQISSLNRSYSVGLLITSTYTEKDKVGQKMHFAEIGLLAVGALVRRAIMRFKL